MTQFIIVVLLISLSPIFGTFLMPALPELARTFDLTPSAAQWIMSIFLIGYGVGALLWKKGDQRAIYLDLTFAFAGSLLCYYSSSFLLFCVGRFLQGLGTAAGIKIYFPVLHGKQRGSAMILSFAVLPGLALLLSGFLIGTFGVHAVLAFLIVFSIFVAALSFYFCGEAKSKPAAPFPLLKQFKDPFLVYHALLVSLGISILFLFVNSGPLIAISEMHLTPPLFALWNLLPILGLAAGFFVATHFSPRLPPRIGMISGIILSILAVIVMGALFTRGYGNAPALFLTLPFLFCGAAIFTTSALHIAIEEASNKEAASTATQIINIGISTLLIIGVATALPLSAPILAATFGAILALGLGIWLKLKAHHG